MPLAADLRKAFYARCLKKHELLPESSCRGLPAKLFLCLEHGRAADRGGLALDTDVSLGKSWASDHSQFSY